MSREPLTSLQNPRVKQGVKLRDARERKRSGLTRVDGGRELLRALDAGLRPETVFVHPPRLREEAAEAVARCESAKVDVQPVTEAVYDKLRYGDRDEGLCALLRWQPATLDALELAHKTGTEALYLVVEGVEKPGNLGALLRTADAAGVAAVLLADPACEPANPNVIRASMGTLFTQPVIAATAADVRAWLAAHGVRAVLTRPDASELYTEADLTGRLAVVMGAEHEGLDPAWGHANATGLTSVAVRLPMAGFADSLNLAAATAIVLYEAVRQRGLSAP